jgi:hypothetical protein
MTSKVTFETVRKIALSLPGVEEGTSYGGLCFRVGGKRFAGQAVNKSAEPNSLGLSIDFDQRDALIAEAPETYYLTDHYVPYPCVLVRLGKVTPSALRDLLLASYRFTSAKQPKARAKRRSR